MAASSGPPAGLAFSRSASDKPPRGAAFQAAVPASAPAFLQEPEYAGSEAGKASWKLALRQTALYATVPFASWISCRFHTRMGSRWREATASAAARAPLIVVMHGIRYVTAARRMAFSS